jgi:hypothetical protein
MNIALPLESMSVEEKILTMELIWNDLSSQISNITSPNWHKDILNEREQSVQQGIEIPIDWEIAKQNLRHKLNEN